MSLDISKNICIPVLTSNHRWPILGRCDRKGEKLETKGGYNNMATLGDRIRKGLRLFIALVVVTMIILLL